MSENKYIHFCAGLVLQDLKMLYQALNHCNILGFIWNMKLLKEEQQQIPRVLSSFPEGRTRLAFSTQVTHTCSSSCMDADNGSPSATLAIMVIKTIFAISVNKCF